MTNPRAIGMALLLLCCGCAGMEPRASLPTAEIAVLPAHNETTNADAGELIRDLSQRWVVARGYTTVSSQRVTKAWEALGKPDTAHLSADSLQKLQTALNADAFLMVDVIEFTHLNRGFSHERRVAATLKLVDAHSGAVLWQNTDQEISKGSTSNPQTAVYDYIKQWATQQLEKTLRSPLYEESSALIARLTQTLPTYKPA